jgi:asparagine synthase (glutamine-hydrolysing)
MRLPAAFKIHKNEKKYLLRTALRGKVPNAILDAPKTGFGVPMEYWLAKPLAGYMKEVLSDELTRKNGIFDTEVLAKMIEEHTSGKRDHGILLYRLLVFTLWQNRYLA